MRIALATDKAAPGRVGLVAMVLVVAMAAALFPHPLKASGDVLGEDVQPSGGAFFSDAGPLSGAGTPCVVFGPGDIGKAHSPDEYLEIGELLRCVAITERIIRAIGEN